MNKRRFFLIIFLFFPFLAFSKPPELTPRDTRGKIEEILKAHVAYHQLTPEIIQRAFSNYLEEIDPLKIHFIESEILKWKNPTPELLEQTVNNLRKENFSTFEELHHTMILALERRNRIEKSIANKGHLKKLQPTEIKSLEWAHTEQELEERIWQIRSLQLESAERLDQEMKSQFLKRLEKKRINREEEIIGKTPKERLQLILSLVLKSVSSALDSQTAYFTPAEASQFMIQVQQRLFGIGAQLRDDFNGFTIVRVIEGGPASGNGKLKAGDKIIAVGGEPVLGMEITEVVEFIRGPKGTPVSLTILRETGEEEQKTQEKLEVEITRGEVILKETRLDTQYEPYGDGVIGILHLFSFYQDSTSSSATDLANVIEQLKTEHNLKGIILDLHNNAGGLLPQAVAVTSLFIKKGIVVSVKDNTGRVQHLRNVDGKVVWNGPLLVLTNRASASAAEIVAQTLQDYGRALVVGDETTYGKGTFQTFTLEASNYGKVNPKGEFKVTRGCYYTVSGKSPQLAGVRADIVVPGIYHNLELGEKYSKFPLENDQIDPNFEDELNDVPIVHRSQIARLYKTNLQSILTTYRPYLGQLQKNSAERIQQSKNYQNFLKTLSEKESASELAIESHGESNLQLVEACNIMKDLIFLLEQDPNTDSPKEDLPPFAIPASAG